MLDLDLKPGLSKSTTSGLLAPPTICTNEGFLVLPVNQGQGQGQGGLIALHVMRSVLSLARMGSWAHFSGEDNVKEVTATKEGRDGRQEGRKGQEDQGQDEEDRGPRGR